MGGPGGWWVYNGVSVTTRLESLGLLRTKEMVFGELRKERETPECEGSSESAGEFDIHLEFRG